MPITVLHDARRALTDLGAYVMTHVDVSRCLRIAGDEWDALAAHWDDLPPDPYAAQVGTTRFRRYGQFLFDGPDTVLEMPHEDYVPTLGSDPPSLSRRRSLAPLTGAFAAEPLFGRLLRMLAWLAEGLDSPTRWTVRVHPLRVLATDRMALPTPEVLHSEGVTLVTALLINRSNTAGGETAVVDAGGLPVMTTTLIEPGTMVLTDDRHTMHGVSPIRPAHLGAPAVRDVLMVTFAPYEQSGEFRGPEIAAAV